MAAYLYKCDNVEKLTMPLNVCGACLQLVD